MQALGKMEPSLWQKTKMQPLLHVLFTRMTKLRTASVWGVGVRTKTPVRAGKTRVFLPKNKQSSNKHICQKQYLCCVS